MKNLIAIILLLCLFSCCNKKQAPNPNARCGYKTGDRVWVDGDLPGVITNFGSAYEDSTEVSVKYITRTGKQETDYIDCAFLSKEKRINGTEQREEVGTDDGGVQE